MRMLGGVATPAAVSSCDLPYQTKIYDLYNRNSTGKSPSSQYSDLNNPKRADWPRHSIPSELPARGQHHGSETSTTRAQGNSHPADT